MQTPGTTVAELLNNVPEDRLEAFTKLHEVIAGNLPDGFEAAISYGGLGYVVPHSVYPSGYHCKPSEPLPFAGIAYSKTLHQLILIWVFCASRVGIGCNRISETTANKNSNMGKVVSASKNRMKYRMS